MLGNGTCLVIIEIDGEDWLLNDGPMESMVDTGDDG